MMGIEYILLHYQDPILYIIRKQKRLSPKQGNLLTFIHGLVGVKRK